MGHTLLFKNGAEFRSVANLAIERGKIIKRFGVVMGTAPSTCSFLTTPPIADIDLLVDEFELVDPTGLERAVEIKITKIESGAHIFAVLGKERRVP